MAKLTVDEIQVLRNNPERVINNSVLNQAAINNFLNSYDDVTETSKKPLSNAQISMIKTKLKPSSSDTITSINQVIGNEANIDNAVTTSGNSVAQVEAPPTNASGNASAKAIATAAAANAKANGNAPAPLNVANTICKPLGKGIPVTVQSGGAPYLVFVFSNADDAAAIHQAIDDAKSGKSIASSSASKEESHAILLNGVAVNVKSGGKDHLALVFSAEHSAAAKQIYDNTIKPETPSEGGRRRTRRVKSRHIKTRHVKSRRATSRSAKSRR